MRLLRTLFFLPPTTVIVILITRLFYLCHAEILLPLILIVSIGISYYLSITVTLTTTLSRFVWFLLFLTPLIFFILLASLSDARNIGLDGSLAAKVQQLQTVAKDYFQRTGNSYESFCDSSALANTTLSANDLLWKDKNKCFGPILKLFIHREDTPNIPVLNCHDSKTSYAVEMYLPNWKLYQCIDGTGVSIRSKQSIGATTSCPSEY